jgi:hypothetical protein
MKNAERPSKSGRVLVGLISLTILTLGAGTLLRGGLDYQNWSGGNVFAPFAIVIGFGSVMVAAFAPKALTDESNKRRRIRGWPTGKARYYRNRE